MPSTQGPQKAAIRSAIQLPRVLDVVYAHADTKTDEMFTIAFKGWQHANIAFRGIRKERTEPKGDLILKVSHASHDQNAYYSLK